MNWQTVMKKLNKSIIAMLMKKNTGLSVLIVMIIILATGCNKEKKELVYTYGEWYTDTLGYHRVEMQVNSESDVVLADIPWRRRDKEPEKKKVIITDAETGEEILNIYPVSVNNENGVFVFQPDKGNGKYYLYYLPGRSEGRSNYPKINYPGADYNADNAWISLHKLDAEKTIDKLPHAKIISIQSSDIFNSFYPMEIIATQEEISQLKEKYEKKTYLLFPEDRSNSIRMTNYLPEKWIDDGPSASIKAKAKKGEYYSFQIGLYNVGNKINSLDISFSDLADNKGNTIIPASEISSFNTGGSGWDGLPFTKDVIIENEKIQALWFGVQIPEKVNKGLLKGQIIITPEGHVQEIVDIRISVENESVIDHGDNNPHDMTRMRWFNSRLAFDDEVVKPFIPIEYEDKSLSFLGRQLDIGSEGLPSRYLTWFNSSNTAFTDKAENVFRSPVSFNVIRANGTKVYFINREPEFNKCGPGKYEWTSSSESSGIELETKGSLEFDGFSSITVKLKALKDVSIADINMTLSLRKKFANYIMGLGLKGGLRPYNIRWKWDQMKHQEGAWIGGINGGLQFALRDDKYERPLNTNFYREKPLIMPESWYNEGKGGINISSTEYSAHINCYSGRRELKEGDELVFKINFLFTPFKTIDTDQQWSTRFFHRYQDIDSIFLYGANTINVHHANEVNPWINYPFLEQEKMKSYIDSAHAKGMKVKIYNTIRELSNRAPELFAIRSFGHEIFTPGEGNGFNWLQEHLVDDYIAAWFVPHLKDAAIINSGMSRWHNYYIEGMDWLTRNMEIDGLYLDDVAFNRTTMKRLRKVLDRNRDGALIDLHSANQYNVRDGFTNSANLYMEHFPYINRLWFGEYFDPELPPDFWLVEMSGIPFGLMGEMLQGGGNKYRGLIYGMTSRAPWSGDPRSIWALFDEFGMENCDFTGYWSDDCPVRTGYRNAPATVYRNDDRVMVVIASWYDETKNIWLNVDWQKLGMKRNEVVFRGPSIQDFQDEFILKPWERIPIEPGKGIVLFIEKK